ncbi:hypothetical protein DFR49_1513 [Hephaestia caeni]|uniref:Uncharacterized protein n=1 Tax=Hephaestia caeni TaxID=645617 RepID=A0A397PMK6_9SPHN|nr:hypothetical protein [Hephaestia caeni]RIA46951.1 hypothetical protein DFR49_1513 [Hephaestia caeni]
MRPVAVPAILAATLSAGGATAAPMPAHPHPTPVTTVETGVAQDCLDLFDRLALGRHIR